MLKNGLAQERRTSADTRGVCTHLQALFHKLPANAYKNGQGLGRRQKIPSSVVQAWRKGAGTDAGKTRSPTWTLCHWEQKSWTSRRRTVSPISYRAQEKNHWGLEEGKNKNPLLLRYGSEWYKCVKLCILLPFTFPDPPLPLLTTTTANPTISLLDSWLLRRTNIRYVKILTINPISRQFCLSKPIIQFVLHFFTVK